LQRILIDELLEAIPADRAAVVISDDRGVEFRSVFAWSRAPNAPVQVSRTVVRSVIGDNVALLCNEPANTESFRQAHSLAVSATRSLICAPLAFGGQPRGALYIASSDPAMQFDESQLQLVAAIAALAGIALQNVERIEMLENEARELRAHVASTHNLIGESDAMRHTCELIVKAARTDTTVLILGESGTGKELAARAVHVNSPRARRPFVAITAAVLSETLLESELFGHEKGRSRARSPNGPDPIRWTVGLS
jgi:transcriptional regulator with GAF, ATPase, and Fis domain